MGNRWKCKNVKGERRIMRKENLKRKILMILSPVMSMGVPVSVFASDYKPSDIKENTGNDILAPLTNTVKEFGASAFNLGTTTGIIVAVLMTIASGLCFMAFRSVQKRDENKSSVGYLVLGAAFVFGAIPIVEVLMAIFGGNN